jgi:Domain of unknown function (DUF6249)
MHEESIIIPIGMFLITYLIIKASLDYKTRKQLIEKGLVNKDIKFLGGLDSGFMSSLKWGLVLTGIGFALLISRLAASNLRDKDEVMFGAMFLAAGIGLVIHYLIVLTQSKKSPNGNGNGNDKDNKMITL